MHTLLTTQYLPVWLLSRPKIHKPLPFQTATVHSKLQHEVYTLFRTNVLPVTWYQISQNFVCNLQ